jgi:hypothetical protein
MYPTHTLLAQVAADRSADAERGAAVARDRRATRSRRTWSAVLRGQAPRAPQAAFRPVQPVARPNVTSLSRPHSSAA